MFSSFAFQFEDKLSALTWLIPIIWLFCLTGEIVLPGNLFFQNVWNTLEMGWNPSKV